jgi:gpW protein
MALSDADTARLASLQGALDKLITGTAIAEVEYNGERRLYSKADLPTLRDEIANLSSGVATTRARYGTVRVRM